MSKKTMLLALAAVSAAVLAVPTMASAAPVIDNVTSFSGTFGSGTLTTSGEPTITCEGANHATGSVAAGGTSGTISLDFTNCHIVVFGITDPCKTSGAPVSNTITVSGSFDTVYLPEKKPGIKATPPLTTVECSGVTPIEVKGSLLGTITFPACGGSSTTAKLKFASTGATQEHSTEEGGATARLEAKTKTASTFAAAGLNVPETEITYNTAGTLTCP